MGRILYNTTDCFATAKLYEALIQQGDEETRRVYEAEMGMQGVCSAVQLRGILIDNEARKKLMGELEREQAEQETTAAQLLGHEINLASPDQLKRAFYEELHLKPQKQPKTNTITTGEEALERIRKESVGFGLDLPLETKRKNKSTASQLAAITLQFRDRAKQLSTLRSKQYHGRMRTKLTVGGTKSYRLSASKSNMGDGLNHQNQDKRLREVYIPDPGFVMGQMDQERAESLTVAYCSGDPAYIDAHLRENTHVYVARILWPNMAWVGDERDKKFAKALQPDGKLSTGSGRDSMYDKSKMTQHGLNYLLTPNGLARHSGLSEREAQRAYDAYFSAFPLITQWHERVIAEVRDTGVVRCPGGYHRVFFGRRWDRATWREAISFVPQSLVAWTNHIVFARLFHALESDDFNILTHVHDAVVWQARQEKLEYYLARVKELCKVKWPIDSPTGKRIMVIPFEIKTGRNWKEVS